MLSWQHQDNHYTKNIHYVIFIKHLFLLTRYNACQDFYLWYLQNSFCNATNAPFRKSTFLILGIVLFSLSFFPQHSFFDKTEEVHHTLSKYEFGQFTTCMWDKYWENPFPFFIRLFISSTHYVSCEGWWRLQNTNQMRFSCDVLWKHFFS